MPKVPTYDGLQSRVGPSPTARFATQDTSAITGVQARQTQEMGGALTRAGGEVARIALDIQNNVNDAEIKKRDVEVADGLRAALHDPESGYLNQQGEAAVNNREAARKLVQEHIRKGGEGLTNDVQRSMWEAASARRMESALNQIDAHAADQTKVFNENQTTARIKSNAADVVSNWAGWQQKGSQYSVAKATALHEFDALATLRGYGADQKAQGRAELLASMHADVVNNMVSLDQHAQAKAYLDANVQDIAKGAPDKLDQLRNLVAQSGVKDQSLNLSMQIKGGLNEQINTVDEMFKSGKISAEVRDATVQRFEHDYSLRKAQESEGTKALLGGAQDWLLKNPDKSVQDMPVGMYNGLKNNGHLDSMVSFAKNGRFSNDAATWAQVSTMSPADLAAMTPTEFYNTYRTKLDDQHLERGYALLAAVSGQGEDKHLEIFTANERIKTAAQRAGVIPNDGSKIDSTQAEAYNQFQDTIDKRVRAFEATQLGGKRKATGDELQQVIDQTLMDRVNLHKGAWFDTKDALTATLTPEQQADAYVEVGGKNIALAKIPVEAQAKYTNKLRARGIPVTQQRIAEMWAADNQPSK